MDPVIERKQLAVACVLAAMQHPRGPGAPSAFVLLSYREIPPQEEGSAYLLGVYLEGLVSTESSNQGEEKMAYFQADILFKPGEGPLSWKPSHINLRINSDSVIAGGGCRIFTSPGCCNIAISICT